MSEPHKVSKPKNYLFFVMDGRAHTDLDEASIIKAVEEEANYERVWNYFHKFYEEKGYDYALVVGQKYAPGKIRLISPVYSLEDLLYTIGEI